MNKKRIFILLLTAVMLSVSLFSDFGSIRSMAATDVNTKLKENLIPLKTTKAKSGLEDLQPLKKLLKDKKIIGIGESTLGSKEFYEIKNRMVEFLVEEMGYRLFAIDAEFADVNAVNDYILAGEGSIDEAIWALRHFMWSSTKLEDNTYVIDTHAYLSSWTTTEVAHMIEWMREYNKDSAVEYKIKFYGIDIELPENSIDNLFEYLYIVDEEVGTKYSRKLSDLVIIHAFNLKYPTSRPLGLFTGMIEELEEELKANKQQYIDKSSVNQYEMANQYLNTIIQWIDYRQKNLNYGTKEALDARDYHMAENIKWILDYEEQFGNNKIIILGHNRNISKKVSNQKSMGENLKEVFGDKYYAIGSDFYQGRFRAFGVDIWGNPVSSYLAKFNIKSSSKKTLSSKLEQTEIPISYLDFKSPSEDNEIEKLLSSNQQVHNIGLMYPGKYVPSRYLQDLNKTFYDDIPLESYDGFIFIKEVSETTGVYDKRDTKIEDGDKEIINHYIHILFGQISTILTILMVIILIILFVRKKIKRKRAGIGARYPNSSRWD